MVSNDDSMNRARLPNRQSIRLRGFDYAQNGAYFVTVCTTQRLCLFGEIDDGEMRLSPLGQAVDTHWQDLPAHTAGLMLDIWIVMPNHLHGIILLTGIAAAQGARSDVPRGPAAGSLGAVIGGFKSAVSRHVAAENLTPVRPIWQRNYHERVIRNDREFEAIRRYIEDNPARWENDPEHPRLSATMPSPPRP